MTCLSCASLRRLPADDSDEVARETEFSRARNFVRFSFVNNYAIPNARELRIMAGIEGTTMIITRNEEPEKSHGNI